MFSVSAVGQTATTVIDVALKNIRFLDNKVYSFVKTFIEVSPNEGLSNQKLFSYIPLSHIRLFADLGHILLPTICFAYILISEQDLKRAIYFAISIYLQNALTVKLKGLFPAFRPNGELGAFPSGHAMISSVSTVTFWIFESIYSIQVFELELLMGVVSILVMLSRLITGHHYPSDLIAGAVAGYALAYFSQVMLPQAIDFTSTKLIELLQLGQQFYSDFSFSDYIDLSYFSSWCTSAR